jgi:hypothetical protein
MELDELNTTPRGLLMNKLMFHDTCSTQQLKAGVVPASQICGGVKRGDAAGERRSAVTEQRVHSV